MSARLSPRPPKTPLLLVDADALIVESLALILDVDTAAERQLRTPGSCLDEIMECWERRYIDAALKLSHGNLSHAARLLSINRTTLYSRIERFNHLPR